MIYLDDLLILGNSMSEIFMARNSVIFLLQHLGFVKNLKKCVLDPAQEIEFLSLIVDSQTMTLLLPAEKIGKIKDQCLRLYKASKVTLLDLTKIIGTLSSTIQAVLPARLQFRFLQQQQIVSLKQTQSYLTLVKLSPMAQNELLWWVNNLELCNDRLVIQPQAQVLIQTNASKKGWGAVCRGIRTGAQWSKKEQDLHINQLELLAIKFAILTFAKMWKMSAIHIQVDNMTALSYLLKMGGTKNPELMQISKDIWEFLLGQEITITAEYLPGNLNYKADWEYRHQKDSSEWKMCPLFFSKIWQILEKKPEIDLFASRLSNQLPNYYPWKPDPNSLGTDTLQQKWYHKSLYAFPLFALIYKVLEKSRGGESPFCNNSNSNLADPKLVPRTLTTFSEKPNHFATKGRLTKGSSKPTASSYPKSNNATSSVGYLRKRLTEEGVSERASDLILSSRRESTLSNYSSAWNKWISWCIEQNVDPVRCNVNWILDFLAFLFESGYEYR